MNVNKMAQARIECALRAQGFDVAVLKPGAEDGAHMVVRWKGGPAMRVRVRARKVSKAKRHAAIRFPELDAGRKNFIFALYSDRGQRIWLMSAEDISRESGGKKFLNFLGDRKDELAEYAAGDFDRLKNGA